MRKKELWKDIFQYTLGAILVLGLLVIIYWMFQYPDSVKDNGVFNTVFGAYTASVIMAVTYFFGSSKDRQTRTKCLRTVMGVNEKAS